MVSLNLLKGLQSVFFYKILRATNMGKFKQLTGEERKIIINLFKDGHTQRYIAEKLNKSQTSICKVISIYKVEKRVSRKSRPGRPKITAERVDKRILEISNSDPFKSVPKIRAQLLNEGKDAPSVYTIRNRLRQNNKHGRVARKMPYLSKINWEKRRHFYEEHVLKPKEFWHSVLWMDESII